MANHNLLQYFTWPYLPGMLGYHIRIVNDWNIDPPTYNLNNHGVITYPPLQFKDAGGGDTSSNFRYWGSAHQKRFKINEKEGQLDRN